MILAPQQDEFAPAFAGYVARVAAIADPLQELPTQRARLRTRLTPLSDEQGLFRYAPSKWSVKEMVVHLSDAERIFSYRLLRIGRGDATPLASFEENDYARAAQADQRRFDDVLEEWSIVRDATTALARSLPEASWTNRGASTSGSPMSARALLFIILGHTEHHLSVLADRYRV